MADDLADAIEAVIDDKIKTHVDEKHGDLVERDTVEDLERRVNDHERALLMVAERLGLAVDHRFKVTRASGSVVRCCPSPAAFHR